METDTSANTGPEVGLSALCLDGGGYLGLATAAFLAECERHFDTRCADRFDLFCGTSTGGLIALALAHGKSAREIVDLYCSLGSRVFRNPNALVRWGRGIRSLFRARYDNRELASVLDEVFGDATLGDVSARGKRVLVPAYCLTTGRPRVFKTDHSPELTAHNGYRLRDVALATAAAPTYLPAVSITAPTSHVDETFIDGGVCANNPTLLAYSEALGYLDKRPEQVRILSISTPRGDLAEGVNGGPSSRGAIRWGLRLPELLIEGPMALSDSALSRLLSRESYRRISLPTRPGLCLDNASPDATAQLKQIGADEAASNATRESLAAFFGACNG